VRIRGLELELEEQQGKSVKEVKDVRLKSEEQLAQLRNFYELERDRLEKRILEEKDRNERRFSQFTEEFDLKMKEEQSNYEEEIENLKEELKEQESQSQALIQQYEHELAMRQKTIETLEKYVKETRENLLTLQSTNSSNIEHQIISFEKERKNLLDKVEKISADLSKKEKEYLTVSQQKDYIEHSLRKKEAQLENLRKESLAEKETMNSKLEESKSKLQRLSDELLEKKIDFGREVALAKQQNEFLSKRLEDYQRQNDGLIDRYEEKLSKLILNILFGIENEPVLFI
jgi:chromosome segregation ATPase